MRHIFLIAILVFLTGCGQITKDITPPKPEEKVHRNYYAVSFKGNIQGYYNWVQGEIVETPDEYPTELEADEPLKVFCRQYGDKEDIVLLGNALTGLPVAITDDNRLVLVGTNGELLYGKVFITGNIKEYITCIKEL